jgi:FAD dependent monooxygenase
MAQSDPVTSRPFRVVIVGAGFVGLSLSHALQLANIDHVVLEKHDKVVSLRGAALIIFPGVARIFDQFGILEKIHQSTTPIMVEHRRWPDGSLNSSNHFLQRVGDLFDIKNILSDRHAIVTHLYENLPDKSKIRTGKRIERIEHTDVGVRVHLSDGSIEEGDM